MGVYRTADETVAEENAVHPSLSLEEDPNRDALRALKEGFQIGACLEVLNQLDNSIAVGYTFVGVAIDWDEIFENNHFRALRLHEIEVALWFTTHCSIIGLAHKLSEYHSQLTAVPARSEMQTHTRRKLIEYIESLLEEIKLLEDWRIEREARLAYFSRY